MGPAFFISFIAALTLTNCAGERILRIAKTVQFDANVSLRLLEADDRILRDSAII